MERLKRARVAVFGAGGVGGYAIEALVRSGVGEIDIIDGDRVAVSNLNRQITATRETVGMDKVEAAKRRALSINSEVKINAVKRFFMPENADEFDFAAYDYIIDAIDTVTAKTELIVRADSAETPIISCMGAGNKLNAHMLEVEDIYKTSVCPLARVMRRELRARGIRRLRVVYSKEPPIRPDYSCFETDDMAERFGSPKPNPPGSTAFVPAVAGLIAAGEVIKAIAAAPKKGR